MPPPPPWQKVQNGEKTNASGGSNTNVNTTKSSFISLNSNDTVNNVQRDAYRSAYSRDSARSFSNYSGSNHHHQNLQNGQVQQAEPGTQQRQYDASLINHESSDSLQRSAHGYHRSDRPRIKLRQLHLLEHTRRIHTVEISRTAKPNKPSRVLNVNTTRR
ncbi:hypothetical protein K435DRAFT_873634 [Dendrothele bispora CBS 962.96]|uniref:Uncharacterized protein n=1 Tax=Dendrothele bispora (strain CBS 962.96) TaxID=1314807 RepID=A0A4S8KYM4_DENBC|nr:hypothetical protein K435DRAFT_873634 [Dendrothele bispora CBS 962.96]